jgi:hypothetical protein
MPLQIRDENYRTDQSGTQLESRGWIKTMDCQVKQVKRSEHQNLYSSINEVAEFQRPHFVNSAARHESTSDYQVDSEDESIPIRM